MTEKEYRFVRALSLVRQARSSISDINYSHDKIITEDEIKAVFEYLKNWDRRLCDNLETHDSEVKRYTKEEIVDALTEAACKSLDGRKEGI